MCGFLPHREPFRVGETGIRKSGDSGDDVLHVDDTPLAVQTSAAIAAVAVAGRPAVVHVDHADATTSEIGVVKQEFTGSVPCRTTVQVGDLQRQLPLEGREIVVVRCLHEGPRPSSSSRGRAAHDRRCGHRVTRAGRRYRILRSSQPRRPRPSTRTRHPTSCSRRTRRAKSRRRSILAAARSRSPPPFSVDTEPVGRSFTRNSVPSHGICGWSQAIQASFVPPGENLGKARTRDSPTRL